jgi:hypothetical protein
MQQAPPPQVPPGQQTLPGMPHSGPLALRSTGPVALRSTGHAGHGDGTPLLTSTGALGGNGVVSTNELDSGVGSGLGSGVDDP